MHTFRKNLYLLGSGAICFGWLQAFPLIDFGSILVTFLNNLAQILVSTLLGGAIDIQTNVV